MTMIGKKLMTVPHPAKTPSITSEWTTGFTPAEVRAASQAAVTASTPRASQSARRWPTAEKVSQKTRAMIPTKAGMAV